VSQLGGDEVAADVGGDGGTLELSNGARLDIARGALSSRTRVTFSIGAQPLAFQIAREDQQAVGPTLQVTPTLIASEGSTIVVSIPFTGLPSGFGSEDLAVAVEMMDDQNRVLETGSTRTRWQFLPAAVERNRLRAELAEVPGMRLQFVAAR
jgi:hypothetical protein